MAPVPLRCDLAGTIVRRQWQAQRRAASSEAVPVAMKTLGSCSLSCRRATIETDDPGSSVSAAIRRFNVSGHCRRFAKSCFLLSIHFHFRGHFRSLP